MRKLEKSNEILKPIFISKWKGVFSTVMLDEGHEVRHVMTRLHASILLLQAPINWFLTATPIVNSAFVSPLLRPICVHLLKEFCLGYTRQP